jgi:hypothetical protein
MLTKRRRSSSWCCVTDAVLEEAHEIEYRHMVGLVLLTPGAHSGAGEAAHVQASTGADFQ